MTRILLFEMVTVAI